MGYYKILSVTKKIALKQTRVLVALTLLCTMIAGNISLVQAAAPLISITTPTNNSTQQGMIDLTAVASGDTAGVTFKVAGPGYATQTFAEDTIAPYTVSWDSASAPINKMDHTITATARGVDGTTAVATVKVKLNNSPVPGKVMVVGDSVTQQAFDPDADGVDTYTANAPAATDLLLFKKMGWSTKDVQTTANNYSIFRHPEKFIVAMGLNDAGTFFADGWNPDDLERFRTLINTPHADACVALVLPGHAPTGDTPWFNSWATEIDQARADLAQLAAQRPHTITVDWQKVIDAHPEYVDNDGVHLKTPGTTWQQDLDAASKGKMNPVDAAAAAARQELYWEAAVQCDPPTASFQTPANDATVEGTVPLEVQATGAQNVQFQVDGQNIGQPITSAPYQIEWDSTTMPDGSPTSNGPHTITAVANNARGSSSTSVAINVQNPPIPGTVGLIGDSITLNSLNSSGSIFEPTYFGDKPANLQLSYWMGWTHTQSQADVTQWAANRTPEILIDAYGFNDARPAYPISPFWVGDGFSDVDRGNVLNTLNTVHARSCKVLILPAWGSGLGVVPPDNDPSDDAAVLGWEQAYIQELQKVRAFYSELATQRDDIVLVDWKPVIDAHPEYMDPDGIHLAHKADGGEGWLTAAAEARQLMYWDGVAQCQELLANR